MSNLVGKTILSRYNVQKFLGRGGMAEVYKVWDSKRMTYLAMKVLLEDLALDRVFIRRFTREANTLAKLQHPNIVRFYDLKKEGRIVFILMDYIEGATLKHLIHDAEGSAMLDGQIRVIMGDVCRALHYAHSQNLTHCDIKPANIMIDKNGVIKLADFGIARVSDAATATMVGAGTPAYMAPEQARGLDPTPKTDIYALGIVLYEMFTGGERPFVGDVASRTGSISEKIRWEQIHAAPEPPTKWNPELSPELERVILKCLEKDPENRYNNTLDLFNAIELAIGEVAEDAPTIQFKLAMEINKSIKLEEGSPKDKFLQIINTLDRKVLWGVGIFIFFFFATVFFLGARVMARPAPEPVTIIYTQEKLPTQTSLPTYTPYPTATEIPVTNTPVHTPTPKPPTRTPGPTSTPVPTVPPCSEGNIRKVSREDTKSGNILTVFCTDGGNYPLPPMQDGKYAVGPNDMFIVYATLDGVIYTSRAGNKTWRTLDYFKHFHVFSVGNKPNLDISILGSHPYSVFIQERSYSESQSFAIPRAITTTQ